MIEVLVTKTELEEIIRNLVEKNLKWLLKQYEENMFTIDELMRHQECMYELFDRHLYLLRKLNEMENK